jgi:hypothetical protein
MREADGCGCAAFAQIFGNIRYVLKTGTLGVEGSAQLPNVGEIEQPCAGRRRREARGPIRPSPVATNACHAKPRAIFRCRPPIFDMDSHSGRDRAPRSSTPANNREAALAMAASAITRRGPQKEGKKEKSKTEKPDISTGQECAANRRGTASKRGPFIEGNSSQDGSLPQA